MTDAKTGRAEVGGKYRGQAQRSLREGCDSQRPRTATTRLRAGSGKRPMRKVVATICEDCGDRWTGFASSVPRKCAFCGGQVLVARE